MSERVWVLTKQSDGGEVQKILGVYADRAELEARVARIAKANKQYPCEQLATNHWRVGPTDDEGFFGNKPVRVVAYEADLHTASLPQEQTGEQE